MSTGHSRTAPAATARLGHLSVRTQLVAGFVALIAMAATIIGVAVWTSSAQQRSEHEVIQRGVPYLTGLSDAALAAKAAANDERGYLLTGQTSYADEARGRRTTEQAGLKQARAAASTAALAAAVAEIESGLTAFNQSLDQEFGLYPSDRAGASKISAGPNRSLRKAYEKSFDKALTLAKARVAATAKAADQQAGRGRLMLLSLLAGMVLVGCLLAWRLSGGVVRSVTAEVKALEAAAHGDLTVRTELRGAREFRRMAQATNDMLAATEHAIATIARGAEAVSQTAGQLAAVNQEIATATDGAAQQAESVSASASQVSTSVETVATAAEEMGSTISEIANSASNAAQVAGEAVRAADEAKTTVAKLDGSSAQIGDVVKTITAIAEQTNLLALNATIEAARAGESGKGFAVVASEVKDLAQGTARATEDIVRQVETIQTDTAQAIAAIARIAEVIAKINDHQGAIASTVEEQSATTQEMNRSISEAANGARTIAEGIGGVAQTVQLTNSETAQARRASSDLAEMGAQLQEMVGRFRYVQVPGDR